MRINIALETVDITCPKMYVGRTMDLLYSVRFPSL